MSHKADEILKRMQAESRARYSQTKPVVDMNYNLPVGIEQKSKNFSPHSVKLYKAAVKKVKKTTPTPHEPLPDLMAPTNSAPKEKEEEVVIDPVKIKKFVEHKEKQFMPEKKKVSMFDSPQKKEVDFKKVKKYAGRAIFNPVDRLPENKEPIKRPPSVYGNKKSLYDIDYNDL